MRDIKKYLHLFTTTEHKLPEKEGYYFCIILEKKTFNPYLRELRFKDGSFWNNSIKRKNVIAYLNLPDLTTKKKAIQLANNVANHVLIGKYFGESNRKVSCSNDIGQMVLDREKEL